jgi:hypothetical protein
MPGLSAAATLDLWERTARLPAVDRAVALAVAAEPTFDVEAMAQLPVGRRDARLLRLRTELAGDTFDAIAACPACGEQVEFAADARTLSALGTDRVDAVPLELDGFRVAWRPPDSHDVVAAATASDALQAEHVLLARCVMAVTGPSGELPAEALPDRVREAVSSAMAAADPLAEVLISLRCPACDSGFEAELDLAGFVWAEVNARAQRVLREVATLARAFGWTEDQTLALTDERRASYLQFARDGAL